MRHDCDHEKSHEHRKFSSIMQPHFTQTTPMQTNPSRRTGSLPDVSVPFAGIANPTLVLDWGRQITLLAVILGGLLQTAQAQAVRVSVYATVTGYGKLPASYSATATVTAPILATR